MLGLAVIAAGPDGAQEDLVGLVMAYQEAKNRQDVDAVQAMFAQHAVFESVGMGTMAGKEQIRALDEYDVGLSTKIEFKDCVQSGNTVTCEVVETNDWLHAAGLKELAYPSSVFTFEDGLIVQIAAALSPESAQAMEQVLRAVVPWIRQHHPEAVPLLFTPENRFIYSRDNALLIVSLLREWRAGLQEGLPST